MATLLDLQENEMKTMLLLALITLISSSCSGKHEETSIAQKTKEMSSFIASNQKGMLSQSHLSAYQCAQITIGTARHLTKTTTLFVNKKTFPTLPQKEKSLDWVFENCSEKSNVVAVSKPDS